MDEGDTCLSVALPASGQSTDKQCELQENKSARWCKHHVQTGSHCIMLPGLEHVQSKVKSLASVLLACCPLAWCHTVAQHWKVPKQAWALRFLVLTPLLSPVVLQSPSLPPGMCRQQPPTWPPCLPLPYTAQHILLKCTVRCCHPLLRKM